MLKLVENNESELLEFCTLDAFGTKIAGYYKTFKTDFPFAVFYLQYSESGEITAAASKIYGSVVISAKENADFEEINEFLNIIGCGAVSCDLSVLKKIGLKVTRQGNIVEFKESSKSKFSSKLDHYPNLPKIYDLLTKAGFDNLGDRADWMSDISMRMRKDVSLWSTVETSGQIDACACALFITDTAVFLGCVASDPENRKKGLGTDVVLNLAQNLGKNKRVNLFCKDGEIVEFYKKLGFSVVGRWAEAEYLG